MACAISLASSFIALFLTIFMKHGGITSLLDSASKYNSSFFSSLFFTCYFSFRALILRVGCFGFIFWRRNSLLLLQLMPPTPFVDEHWANISNKREKIGTHQELGKGPSLSKYFSFSPPSYWFIRKWIRMAEIILSRSTQTDGLREAVSVETECIHGTLQFPLTCHLCLNLKRSGTSVFHLWISHEQTTAHVRLLDFSLLTN